MEPMSELPDFETAYRAVQGRDPRFDGRLYLGVNADGIYCRPLRPRVAPKPANVPLLRDGGCCRVAGWVPGLQTVPPRRNAGQSCLCGPPVVTWSPGRMRLVADGTVDEARRSPAWPPSCTSVNATSTAASWREVG